MIKQFTATALLTFILVFAIMTIFVGCKVSEVRPDLGQVPTTNQPRIALSWETAKNPERAKWSDHMMSQINVETYLKASDITKFCPKIKSLSLRQQKQAIGEFWVSLGVHESGWNPKSASVDVGTKDNKDTWSVGLFQMSVVDQKSYKKDFGFKYDDLLRAEPNITLANYIMERIITRRGAITLTSNVYWAPLRIGGKYDKIAKIVARTQEKAPFCK